MDAVVRTPAPPAAARYETWCAPTEVASGLLVNACRRNDDLNTIGSPSRGGDLGIRGRLRLLQSMSVARTIVCRRTSECAHMRSDRGRTLRCGEKRRSIRAEWDAADA